MDELMMHFEEDVRKEPDVVWKEVVIEKKGGVRQAGAPEFKDGEFPTKLRKMAQKSLYFFGKAIVGREYLTSTLHLPIMDWLQQKNPARKMLLIPRNHSKTSMVSHCLPAHILIQDKETNVYFPGQDGMEQRILLACETEGRASAHVRVVEGIYEGNKLFRALFPDKVWENPRRDSKKWTELEMLVPRANEYPEPSLFGVGVGKAITGARPTCLIKDDLISLAARGSETVMTTAIEWHLASRALMDEYAEESGLQALEWIIGCVTGDTRVTMADGTFKAIVDVKPGDLVWSAGDDKSFEIRKVLAMIPQGFSKTFAIRTTDHYVKATGNHPFLCVGPKGTLVWKTVERLDVSSDWILALDDSKSPDRDSIVFERVLSVVPNVLEEEVYDLTVEGTPSFFANGLAVHNTRWAVYDLYQYIISGDPLDEMDLGDPTVEVMVRSIVEDGKTIWPERFSMDDVMELKRSFKSLFYLLYMNDTSNAAVTSFDPAMLRLFWFNGDKVVFKETASDAMLASRWSTNDEMPVIPEGAPLTSDTMDLYLSKGRGEYLRWRSM